MFSWRTFPLVPCKDMVGVVITMRTTSNLYNNNKFGALLPPPSSSRRGLGGANTSTPFNQLSQNKHDNESKYIILRILKYIGFSYCLPTKKDSTLSKVGHKKTFLHISHT